MNEKMMTSGGRPRVAILDPNTLAAMGMKQILQNVLPIMDAVVISSFDSLVEQGADSFAHYFVAMNIVLEHRQFFLEHRVKTIVLSPIADGNAQLADFRSICINVPEKQLVRSILMLEQHAHAHGKNLPPMPKILESKILSDREIEVLSLIAQGFINKEIADKLNISQTTVVTHRQNITYKLGIKSVSALTIYAVMHGYVDINKI
jgi:DNA-binding CsgD family transcriptional regulator